MKVLFLTFAVLAAIGCQNIDMQRSSGLTLEDLTVNSNNAAKQQLNGFGGYAGRVTRISPINRQWWTEYSRPVYIDLSELSGAYSITINMSVWAESPGAVTHARRPLISAYRPQRLLVNPEPAAVLNRPTNIEYSGPPVMGWTLQNGPNGFRQFGGPAVPIQTGRWLDLEFHQSIVIAQEGERSIFIDGFNHHQSLVDLTLYIRSFSVRKEKIHNKFFALTFDDAPSDSTEALLDKLAELGVRATFFINGMNVDAVNPNFDAGLNGEERQVVRARRQAIVRRMFLEGHELANHSYSHNYLGGGSLRGDGIDSGINPDDIPYIAGYTVTNFPLGEDDIRRELADTQIAIQRAVFGDHDYMNHPQVSRFFRSPFNVDNRYAVNLENVTRSMGFPRVYGIGSEDYLYGMGAREIADLIFRKRKPWGVSLNHVPTPANNAIIDAIAIIVPKFLAEGYEFVTLSEMERQRRRNLIPGNVYQNLDPHWD